VAADVRLPGLREGDAARVAVEGYPARLAFEQIGRRSYKNGDDPERRAARRALLQGLERDGSTALGLRLGLASAQRAALESDAGGDRLDAVLCLMQAAWAQAQPDHGVPAHVDRVEGWIVGGAAGPAV
jgi:hypothetical protein